MNVPDPLIQLSSLMFDQHGAAEPRSVALALARVPVDDRDTPVCRFADAVLARTGDLEAADVAHRAAYDALVGDARAESAVLSSWLGIALNRRDLGRIADLRTRAAELVGPGPAGADATAIVGTIDAAADLVQGRFAEVEQRLVAVLAHHPTGVPSSLRGAVAMLRSFALQSIGSFDAAVRVIDADTRSLGAFDLAAELVRARCAWLDGDRRRARALVAAVHADARRRGRQHDGDFAAAVGRLYARFDGDTPELPRPPARTPVVMAMVALDDALSLLPDEAAARRHLETHPEVRTLAGELAVAAYLLCPSWRDSFDRIASADPTGALTAAARLVRGDAREIEPTASQLLPCPWSRPQSSSSPQRPVRVCVLGPVCVTRPAGDVVAVPRERTRALLVVLALHRRITRDRAAAMLWPDKAPADAANNLRTTLSYVRRLVPNHPLVSSEGATLTLTGVEVDVWDLDDRSTAARVAEAAGRRDEAMVAWADAADAAGGQLGDGVAACAWLDGARTSVERTALDVLVRAAEIHGSQASARARAWARRAIELDRWHEPAWVALAQAWRSEGRPDIAVDTAREARDVLAEIGGITDPRWSSMSDGRR